MSYRFLLFSLLVMQSLAHPGRESPGVLIVEVVNHTGHQVSFYNLTKETAIAKAEEFAAKEQNGNSIPLERKILGNRSDTPGPDSPLSIPTYLGETSKQLTVETSDGLKKFALYLKGSEIVLDPLALEREFYLGPEEGIKQNKKVKGRLILWQNFLDRKASQRAKFCPINPDDLLEPTVDQEMEEETLLSSGLISQLVESDGEETDED